MCGVVVSALLNHVSRYHSAAHKSHTPGFVSFCELTLSKVHQGGGIFGIFIPARKTALGLKLLLQPVNTLHFRGASTDGGGVGRAIFHVFIIGADDISDPLSEIYCTYHVTDSTRIRPPPGFCHCWSVRLEQCSGPCPQSELHPSCFKAQ